MSDIKLFENKQIRSEWDYQNRNGIIQLLT